MMIFHQCQKSLIIDDLRLPDEVNVDILMDYVKTIDEGILKREIEKTKKQIKEIEILQKGERKKNKS